MTFRSNGISLLLTVVLVVHVPPATARAAIQSDASGKLTAGDASAANQFGLSVAVDGDTAVVGAPHNGGDANPGAGGAAYVYVRSGTSWTQQAKLVSNDIASLDQFGFSVALSGDTLVVGAIREGPSGSAYVFVRSGTTWTQQAKLAPGSAAPDFGYSVAVDGDTAVVSAPRDNDAGNVAGAAYVFVRSGTTWSEQDKITAADAAAEDQFGFSVALSGDTALMGAFGDDDDGFASGSAYVFVRSGTTWSEQAKLTPAQAEPQDVFGSSVALSGDTAVIGAYGDDDAGNSSGSAYVFVRSGNTWTQQTKLSAADAGFGKAFGFSVAVDGDTAVVGAYSDGNASQSAYVFVRSGTTWTEQAKLTAADAASGDRLGWSVAVSSDTAVVGSPFDDDAGTDSGSAYVFTSTAGEAPPSECDDPSSICGDDSDEEIQGTPEDEFIYGGGGDDTIDGGGGNDVIVGSDGNDTIVGGAGSDKLEGGAGNDVLIGDAPQAHPSFAGGLLFARQDEAGAPDTLIGGDGNDSLSGGGGGDQLDGGTGVDSIMGGSGNDSVTAGDQKDNVNGGGGDDRIKGDGGNDNLKGAAGNDVLNGGAAPTANTMNGGPGRDICIKASKKDKTKACEKTPVRPPQVRGRPL